MQVSNQKLWLITSLSLLLGLLIAWGVVRFLPCETQYMRIYGEPTPAPWPTILEQDNDNEPKAMAVDMASDQASKTYPK